MSQPELSDKDLLQFKLKIMKQTDVLIVSFFLPLLRLKRAFQVLSSSKRQLIKQQVKEKTLLSFYVAEESMLESSLIKVLLF
jgi:hypothetical protein